MVLGMMQISKHLKGQMNCYKELSCHSVFNFDLLDQDVDQASTSDPNILRISSDRFLVKFLNVD